MIRKWLLQKTQQSLFYLNAKNPFLFLSNEFNQFSFFLLTNVYMCIRIIIKIEKEIKETTRL